MTRSRRAAEAASRGFSRASRALKRALHVVVLLLPVAAPGVELAPMTDTVPEPRALNFAKGTFGTCINGQTFQIDALVTHAGWQYATWFDADRHLAVGRRKLPDGAWQTFAFGDYTISHTDVHNVAVIGVCPGDGTVHLSFDHHGHPLHYRVSRPGVATDPDSSTWSAELFGLTTSELVQGEPIKGVTYPAFFSMPDGKLQLTWRTGGSGNGDTWLADYDGATGAWTVIGKFISGQGNYGTSPTRNAYPNGFDYGPAGRLHTTWVWREGEENGRYGLRNCHDLMYAYSEDAGRTWRNNDGDVLELPIRLASPGITVVPLAYRWGMMNQLTQTVDAEGRVHVVLWNNPPDAPGPEPDKDRWRYFHYWRDTDGAWHDQRLPCRGRKPSVLAHPNGDLVMVFTEPDNLEYHEFDPGGPLRIWAATAATGWSDWREVLATATAYVGEPRLDQYRWQQSGVLSIYAQEAPAKPGEPSKLKVMEFASG